MSSSSSRSQAARAAASQRRLAAPRWPLTIRQRTFLIVALSITAVLLLLYLPLRAMFLQSVYDLEHHQMQDAATRTLEAFNASLANTASVTESYGTWDATYNFVEGRDPGYPDVAQNVAAFVTEKRDLVAIVGADGQLRLLRTVDRDSRTIAPSPALPLDPVAGSPLLTSEAEGVKRGLLTVDGRPLLFTSAPILRSDGSGPSVGTIIFGRWLSPVVVAELADTVHLPLQKFRLTESGLSPEIRSAVETMSATGAPLVRPLDGDAVAGYLLLKDVDDQPAVLLRFVEPRTLVQQGENNALLIAGALVLAGLVVGGAIMLLLEQAMLSRIARMRAEVLAVGTSSAPASQVTVEQHDELSDLAEAINTMLLALNKMQREQQAAVEHQLHLQEDVNQSRRQLLSRVSHELRTPLTPIKGFVDLLLLRPETSLDADAREMLTIIRNHTDRMSTLVDDLLELGRADSGQLRLRLTRVNLVGTMQSVVDLLRAEIDRKQLEVTVEAEPDLPLIEADGTRLAQILTNLVSNAAKYTYPGGQISLRAVRSAEQYVQFSVKDNGIGMTSEQLRQLFTPFFRAETPLHTASNGTGLGLLITRTLVELHHGDLNVESRPEAGSRFTVTLPLTQPAPH